jgi:hypothetical protein
VNGHREALIVAVIQIALVASLGVILLVDRAMHPRVWVKTVLIDPEASLRGRYVSLRIEVDAEGSLAGHNVLLSVQDGQLIAKQAESPTGIALRRSYPAAGGTASGISTMQVDPSLEFFLPEALVGHWRGRGGGEKYQDGQPIWGGGVEVWAEVTLPRRGPPRPIKLGIKKEGVVTPM